MILLLLFCCCIVTNVVQLWTITTEEDEEEEQKDDGVILQLPTVVDKSSTTTTRKQTNRSTNVNKNKHNHPVTAENSEKKAVEVVVWPGVEDKDTYSSEFVNVYEDGIRQSPYLCLSFNRSHFLPQLHHNSNNNSNNIYQIDTVWLGLADADIVDVSEDKSKDGKNDEDYDYADTTAGDDWYGEEGGWCEVYEKVVRAAQEDCHRQGYPHCYWHIYIVDFSDVAHNNMTCPGIEAAMTMTMTTTNTSNNNNHQRGRRGNHNPGNDDNNSYSIDGKNLVHYIRRSIVVNREYNQTSQWIVPGHRLELYKSMTTTRSTTTSTTEQQKEQTTQTQTQRMTPPSAPEVGVPDPSIDGPASFATTTTTRRTTSNVHNLHLHRHRHANYPVRSDVVHTLQDILRNNYHHYQSSSHSLSSVSVVDPIESLWIRDVDVSHFWPLDTIHTNPDFHVWHYPKFRWRVSSLLLDFCGTTTTANASYVHPVNATVTTQTAIPSTRSKPHSTSNSNHSGTRPTISTTTHGTTRSSASASAPALLSCWIGVAGSKGEEARRGIVNAEYINLMLRSKIIVLSMRDGWEDQYRLMEAMVSGALVLTDAMLSLPTGYHDALNIVEYHSAVDLLDKITYYLDSQHESERIAIATQGRTLAMTRHRSWHRMEEIIFGRILS